MDAPQSGQEVVMGCFTGGIQPEDEGKGKRVGLCRKQMAVRPAHRHLDDPVEVQEGNLA